MKEQMPVKIFEDACNKAQKHRDAKHTCPLYPRSFCCVEECNVPKFLRWILGDEVHPEDVSEVDES